VRFLKRARYVCLLLIAFSFVGCNSSSTKNQLPTSKPKDFNFVFNYGVSAKNELDTIKGQYTKDMVTEPSITADLKLSDKEMSEIYFEMLKIDILNYPEEFKPKSNTIQTPFDTYSIRIVANGMEKSIFWSDENVSDTKEAVQLRKLFKKIETMIISKEEFMKLPDPKSHYN